MSEVESKTNLREPLFSLQRISREGARLAIRGRTAVAVVAGRVGRVEDIEHFNKRLDTAGVGEAKDDGFGHEIVGRGWGVDRRGGRGGGRRRGERFYGLCLDEVEERGQFDSAEAAVDPTHDGNMFSFYYQSRLRIHRSSGVVFDCEDMRSGCATMTSTDGVPGVYSYLNVATTRDDGTVPPDAPER